MNETQNQIEISRKNWQRADRNEIASPGYYAKCAAVLTDLAAKYIRPNMEIIDLGCADGKFTELLAKFSRKATGYEFSQAMLERAKKLRASEKLEFFPIDLESKGWTLPPCQLALCMGVFTYVHEDAQMRYDLDKINNSLKEGNGEIFITRESLSKTATGRWMNQDKYYSIYRSNDDYYANFTASGFSFVEEIRLFETEYTINAFRVWKRN